MPDFPLSTAPDFRLQMPRRRGLYRPRDFSPSLGLRLLQKPFFVFYPISPINFNFPPAFLSQALNSSGDLSLTFPPAPAAPPENAEGIRIGGDAAVDPATLNKQLSAVIRGFDLFKFGRIALFHEPSFTFTPASATGVGDNVIQFGGAIFNLSITERIELALQPSVDHHGALGLGAQVELHTNDPHFSFVLSATPILEMGKDGYTVTGFMFGFGTLNHFLNP